MEPPVAGETSKQAEERRSRNRLARDEWGAFLDARCARCDHVRFHVFHEEDPATSVEGPDYYADILDQLHPFEELPR